MKTRILSIRSGLALCTAAWAATACIRASSAGAAARQGAKGPDQAAKAPIRLVPIPLELPEPRFVGTPKNVPPGTRVKISEGPARPRPPFLAPKGVKNVAFKKPVISSDMEPVIGTLDLITDGNKEAVEDAYVELGPGVQWVQLDLKARYRIYAIVVWHEHMDARVYHDIVVKVSDDRRFSRDARVVYSNDHDNSAKQGIGRAWEYFETHEGMLIDCRGIEARYVRLWSNGSTVDDLNRYTEVEVYALPLPARRGGGR